MIAICPEARDDGVNQQEITERLSIPQSTVSRLLKKARELNIVKFVVSTPPGTHADLEAALETRFGLKEAIVVDSQSAEDATIRDLAAATAFFLENPE